MGKLKMINILTKTNNKKHATKKYKMKRTKRNNLRQGALSLFFLCVFPSEDSGNPNLHFSLEKNKRKRNDQETTKTIYIFIDPMKNHPLWLDDPQIWAKLCQSWVLESQVLPEGIG